MMDSLANKEGGEDYKTFWEAFGRNLKVRTPYAGSLQFPLATSSKCPRRCSCSCSRVFCCLLRMCPPW